VRAAGETPGAGEPTPGAPPGLDERRHAQAWSAAEEALARGRVPEGMRRHVRDYFLAIRPRAER
jgi:hypothetical protein